MSKKLLIYGLAFGSAAAAMSYIYMMYVATSPDIKWHLISVLGEFVVIPFVAMALFLRTVKQESEETFLIGRVIFLGFFLSVMISASVSLFYSYIAQFNPEVVNQFIDLKMKQFHESKSIARLNAKEIAENEQAIRDSYSVSGQFKYQLYLGAARGLFFSAIIAFFLRAKTKKP